MAEIKLFRIDSRLIHGQIITKWLKVTQADKIVVVDETLAADGFMREIYMAAVPKGISVDIYDTDEAIKEWGRNQFGDGKALVWSGMWRLVLPFMKTDFCQAAYRSENFLMARDGRLFIRPFHFQKRKWKS